MEYKLGMFPLNVASHQWPSGSAFKSGEVPVSIPGRVCRPSRLKFSVVFPETCLNTGYDPLVRTPRRALTLQSKSLMWQLDLILQQPNIQPSILYEFGLFSSIHECY